jgi:hypothetical protein
MTAPDQTSAEQAADMAELQAMAEGAPPVPGQEQATAEQAGPDLGKELEGLGLVVVATLAPMFPSLTKIYTPQVTAAAAHSIAAVCNKHGWMAGGMLGEYGEEIACVAVVGPLALATYQGVSADLEAMRQAQKPKAAIQGPDLTTPAPTAGAPGAKTVSFGAVPA